ncbi:MAG: hypothetical protein QM564_00560 [Bergeyella sp.]
METLILNSKSRKDIEIIKEIALKFGMSIVGFNAKKETKQQKTERLMKLAKIADKSVIPNDITMDEIVEEVRLAREERVKRANKNVN